MVAVLMILSGYALASSTTTTLANPYIPIGNGYVNGAMTVVNSAAQIAGGGAPPEYAGCENDLQKVHAPISCTLDTKSCSQST